MKKNEESEDFIFYHMQEIREEILPHSSEIMKESRMSVFGAIRQLLDVAEIARVLGLDPLLKEQERLAKSDSYLDRFFALGLDEDSLAAASVSSMSAAYDSFGGSVSDRFIMYIYMRGVRMIQNGFSEYAMKEIYKSMLPVEERKKFEAYLKIKRVK